MKTILIFRHPWHVFGMTLNETFNLFQLKVNGDLGAFQITIPSSKNTLVYVESTEDQPGQTHRLYLHFCWWANGPIWWPWLWFVYWSVFCFPSQKYDLDLFRMALPCLSAIAGALPPDYLDTRITATLEKQVSVDADGNFDPKPINTMK